VNLIGRPLAAVSGTADPLASNIGTVPSCLAREIDRLRRHVAIAIAFELRLAPDPARDLLRIDTRIAGNCCDSRHNQSNFFVTLRQTFVRCCQNCVVWAAVITRRAATGSASPCPPARHRPQQQVQPLPASNYPRGPSVAAPIRLGLGGSSNAPNHAASYVLFSWSRHSVGHDAPQPAAL